MIAIGTSRGTTASAVLRALLVLPLVVLLVSCGSSPTNPSGASLQVSGISPSQGSTFGGTAVTITGQNFGAGATVTFGGAPGTGVVVAGATTITATTPVHAAGAVDVVVTSAGTSKALAAGYTYVAPGTDNLAPVLQSLTASGSRPHEPTSYANIDEAIAVTATVTDNETPVSMLTFAWSSALGSFTGTGPAVTWLAPHAPGGASLGLKVTEHYLAPGPNGLPVDRENVTSGGVAVDVHDEIKEIGDMAVDFLQLFSRSSVSADDVVHNFQDGCGAGGTGKKDERQQTANNRLNYSIISWSVGSPRVTVGFDGTSPYRARHADAWASVDVRWLSQCIGSDYAALGCTSAGGTREDRGIDWVTARYDSATKRWWLCDSDYDSTLSTSTMGWLR